VIFTHSDAQRATAEALIAELTAEKVWHDPIVTEVRPASTFYIAEDYHQEYFANNPQQPYCSFVVAPKVRKFREKFAAKLRQGA
jgi:peptide-methionine (S)-S-oxide reductase